MPLVAHAASQEYRRVAARSSPLHRRVRGRENCSLVCQPRMVRACRATGARPLRVTQSSPLTSGRRRTEVHGPWCIHCLWPAVNWAWRGRPSLGVGIPGLLVARRHCTLWSRWRPATLFGYGVRLHVNSCRHPGHPPSGGGSLPEWPRPGVLPGQTGVIIYPCFIVCCFV